MIFRYITYGTISFFLCASYAGLCSAGSEKDGGNILELEDYEYLHDQLSPVSPGQQETYKEIYRSKETGELWIISKAFDAYNFRYYMAGGIYTTLLGDTVVPEIRLIRDNQNQLRVASKIIPNFTNLATFFNFDASLVSECFPKGCLIDKHLLDPAVASGQEQERITIEGAEPILAAMLFLADMDGHEGNLGLIGEKGTSTYQVGKVDHEEIFSCISGQVPLRSLGKIVFGERNYYTHTLNYTSFDLNKVADAFDQFAKINREDLSRLFVNYLKALQSPIDKGNWSPDLKALDIPVILAHQHSIYQERLKLCTLWAKSLKVEAAIRAGNIKQVKALFKDSLDVNGRYEYLFLDTASYVPQYTLNEMCSMISYGDMDLFQSEFLPYVYAEKPISPLEMAMRYKKPDISKYLLMASSQQTLRDTLNNLPADYKKEKNQIRKLLNNKL